MHIHDENESNQHKTDSLRSSLLEDEQLAAIDSITDPELKKCLLDVSGLVVEATYGQELEVIVPHFKTILRNISYLNQEFEILFPEGLLEGGFENASIFYFRAATEHGLPDLFSCLDNQEVDALILNIYLILIESSYLNEFYREGIEKEELFGRFCMYLKVPFMKALKNDNLEGDNYAYLEEMERDFYSVDEDDAEDYYCFKKLFRRAKKQAEIELGLIETILKFPTNED